MVSSQHHEHGQDNVPCMYYQIRVFLTVQMDKPQKFCRYAVIWNAPTDNIRALDYLSTSASFYLWRYVPK